MKKFFMIAVILILGAFLPWTVSAELKNDPNGFAGMYWGESLNQLQPNMHTRFYKYGPNNDPIYFAQIANANGELYLKGRMAVMISFHNDRLMAITIPLLRCPGYETDQAYNELYAHLRELCGSPNKVSQIASAWSGPYTVMILEKTGEGVVLFLMDARAAHRYASMNTDRS